MDWDVRPFTEIDSTNRWLLEQARAGAPAGLVAVADVQTAGRGRLGRTWVAPPGASLLLSVLLRPDLPPERLFLVTAAVALAARSAVADVAGFTPELKWPNDLLVGERKLAGVLAEAEQGAVVVGIGINVEWPDELPPELADIAVAANHVAGRPVDRSAVQASLLDHLGRLVGQWDEVAVAYRSACATIGRQVRVELPNDVFTGTATDVTADGHLVVDGRHISAGDVVHLRPT